MRVTRLLAVALCAALVCAALVGAAGDSASSASQAAPQPGPCIYDKMQKNVWASTAKFAVSTPSGPQNLLPINWTSIRINVSTEDLKNPAKYCTAVGETKPDFEGGTASCTQDDILTPEKNDTLLNYLLPKAIALHAKHLTVEPLKNLVVPTMVEGDAYCYYNTIPAAHHSAGVNNTDFMLYVSAGPSSAEVAALGTTCAASKFGRPLVGTLHVPPRYIAKTDASVRYVTHQILHALGFGVTLFQKQGMLTNISIRHKAKSGVIKSINTVAKAREHYDCATVVNMELEDEGGSGTTSSHWKRRNANHELMTTTVGFGYYTPITIAAMEDTGFYMGNYTNAELMPWGYHVGCSLTRNKCVNCGVSGWDRVFCTSFDLNQFKCSGDRLGLGVCSLTKYTSPVEAAFQYFPDMHYSGNSSNVEMDRCPMYETTSDPNTVCSSTTAEGSLGGAESRCFDVSDSPLTYNNTPLNAICAAVYCDVGSTSYQVHIKGATSNVTCTDGKTIDLASVSSTVFTKGSVKCPPRYEVCRQVVPTVKSAAAGPFASGNTMRTLIAVTFIYILAMLF